MEKADTPTRHNTEEGCYKSTAEKPDFDDNLTKATGLTTATPEVTLDSMEEMEYAPDEPVTGESEQTARIQKTKQKATMTCNKSSEHFNDDQDNDDDIPLAIIQRALRSNQSTRTPTDCPLSSEHDDSDNDSDYVPSDVTDSSSENVAPIHFDRRKRKWVRRHNRPLKREQGRKDNPETAVVMKHKVKRNKTSAKTKINRSIQRKKTVSTLKQSSMLLKQSAANKTDDKLERAMKLSRLQHNIHSKVKGFHERRLSNILISNGLERISVNPDGNCFFNAVISQLDTTDTAADLRQKICEHLIQNEEHYKVYMSTSSSYKQKIEDMGRDGNWNIEMSDILPLATANVYKRNITIYSSRLNNPVINIVQDLESRQEIEQTNDLKLAYLAFPGFEHYDACVPKSMLPSRPNTSTSVDACEQSHNTHPKTPSKQANELREPVITPRKGAAYISPKKVKRTANIILWKKNIRKERKKHWQKLCLSNN